ncbi:hypothetical protein [Pseudoroseicyclus sp. CXY001]|uniref:hypothetical protein n=1 Tax=Pseudoroseicyclus sp. CXY001 TaxID=3242492 RepID=UPI00358DCCE9
MNEGRQMTGWGRTGWSTARLAGAALAAGLAGCATNELEAADCATTRGTLSTDIPRDLGNGNVATRLVEAGGTYFGSERTEVTHCASGAWVRLTDLAFSGPGEALADRRAATELLISHAATLAPGDVPVYLAEQAVMNNIDYRAGRTGGETCGCRVFYPESAGDMNEGTI